MAKNILVVDDDPLLCSLLESALIRSGFECHTVLNGQNALDHIQKHAPDLVVLDIMMPGIDGFEVARHIRATPQTADTPIIMLTGRIDASSQRNGLDAGVDTYMTKPISPMQLIDAIYKLLRDA